MNGAGVDLSARFSANNTIVASPATAGETVVASVGPMTAAIVSTSGVFITAQVAYNVGTSGTTARYRIRQGTTTSGTVIFDSQATNAGITAAGSVLENVTGFDSAPTFPNQSYCLTVTVGAASATSTVAAVCITALAV